MPLTMCIGPFDHENYPEEIQEMIRRYTYRVSPSMFQVNEWANYKPPIMWDYIPHGVDSKIYFPMDKNEAKKALGIPEDKFVIGTVAANSDKEQRKGMTQSFKAIRMFLDNNPDVKKDDS
jgi:hypothetical protein